MCQSASVFADYFVNMHKLSLLTAGFGYVERGGGSFAQTAENIDACRELAGSG